MATESTGGGSKQNKREGFFLSWYLDPDCVMVVRLHGNQDIHSSSPRTGKLFSLENRIVKLL